MGPCVIVRWRFTVRHLLCGCMYVCVNCKIITEFIHGYLVLSGPVQRSLYKEVTVCYSVSWHTVKLGDTVFW